MDFGRHERLGFGIDRHHFLAHLRIRPQQLGILQTALNGDPQPVGILRAQGIGLLRANPQVREKVVAVYAEAEPFVPSENVDAQLYNGFFSDADRAAMKIVLETERSVSSTIFIAARSASLKNPL